LIGAASVGVENDQDCFHPTRIQSQKTDRGKASGGSLSACGKRVCETLLSFRAAREIFFCWFHLLERIETNAIAIPMVAISLMRSR
jgi:hypothetical protein